MNEREEKGKRDREFGEEHWLVPARVALSRCSSLKGLDGISYPAVAIKKVSRESREIW
jgi:hypothetical protein